MPHFYSSDLIGVAIAALLGIPFILLPGFGLGWWLNLFDFRSLTPATRCSLAPCLGLTTTPILLYLSFRVLSVYAMWATAILLCGAGLAACMRESPFPKRQTVPRFAVVAVVAWTVLCTGLMLDVSVGARLYPSSVIVDTSFRSQVISSLAHSHKLPAASYFFSPGSPVPLRYHYIYFLVPALMVQAGQGIVTASMALVALSLWTGIAFFGVVSAFIRFFWSTDNPEYARNVTWVLLGIGGFDLLFAGTRMIERWRNGQFVFTGPDIGLWNGSGSSFSWLSTALFSPHHLGGLMSGILACVLLWHSREMQGWTRWSSAVAAGLMIATLGGTSLYVGAMFAIFLCIVFLEVLLNARRYLLPLAATGLIAVVLIIPFFLEVRPPWPSNTPAFFNFQVRGFFPITVLFTALGIGSRVAWNLAYLFSLPLTYLCEFGVLFVGGIWWLWDRYRHPPKNPYRDHLILGLMAISIVIPSFAWSAMEMSNDLGFRGVLPAQFLLLFCAADLFTRSPTEESRVGRRLMQFAIFCVVLGAGSTLLEMVTLRGAIGTTSQRTIQAGQMFRPDTSAERLGDLRKAYTWIRNNTPKNAVIQENPITWQLVSLGQYSERATVVYGSNPNYMVGDDHRDYQDLVKKIDRLYSADIAPQRLATACAGLGLDYLVVQQGDPLWNKVGSGGFNSSIVFSSTFVRVVNCGTATTQKTL